METQPVNWKSVSDYCFCKQQPFNLFPSIWRSSLLSLLPGTRCFPLPLQSLCLLSSGLQSCETVVPVETKTCFVLGAAVDERLLQGAGALLLEPPYPGSFHPSVVPVRTVWLPFKWGDQSILRQARERKGAITIFNAFCQPGHWLRWQPNTYSHYTKDSLCFYARTRMKCLCFSPRGLNAPLEGQLSDMQ